MRAEQCIVKLLLDYQFDNVLDVGSGDGRAARIFQMANKNVTTVDVNEVTNPSILGDFNTLKLTRKWQCTWCSHVLEHQLNVGNFLKKILSVTTQVIAITVPPLKPNIVGGHYTVWNMGLLIYSLVMAGFDCNELSGIKEGYNISVLTPVRHIPSEILSKMSYDKGDIEILSPYFPERLNEDVGGVYQGFNGNIKQLNWYSGEVVYE